MNSIGVGAWRIGVGSSRAVVNPGFWKPQIMGGGGYKAASRALGRAPG